MSTNERVCNLSDLGALRHPGEHVFEGSRPVRTLMLEQNPWFVISDVCPAINLKPHKRSYSHHLAKLDDDEEMEVDRACVPERSPRFNLGLNGANFGGSDGSSLPRPDQSTSSTSDRTVWLVSESGLFTIILRSRGATTPGTLPHRFRRWTTGEVLPSIRRTGSYSLPSNKANVPSIEFSEPGRYVTMVVPGQATHTQHYRLEALLEDVAENEAALMALTMKMVEAWWHKVEHLVAIGLETRGSFAAAGLERAIREGATLADRLLT